VIHQALGRPVPIELTDDARIERRVIRLAATSVIALGLLWGLATATLTIPDLVSLALVIGWIVMPITLLSSLSSPRARYLLVVPAILVTLGLLAICLTALPAAFPAAAGWLLVTAGVVLGGLLGLWFWYRVAPVPAGLDDPYAAGRWALIAIHVALVVVGLSMAATALL
jgi:hypothetical protein